MKIQFIVILYLYSIEWIEFPAETCPSPSQLKRLIFQYKGIHMLSNEFNVVFGTIFIPFMKLILFTFCIFGFFISVRLFQFLNPISVAFVVVMMLTSVILLVPVSCVMSNLYDVSSKFPGNLSPHFSKIIQKKRRRILEAHLKSCPVIRCKVGGLYHMEAKAKLTMIHQIINGVVFLMVNFKV